MVNGIQHVISPYRGGGPLTPVMVLKFLWNFKSIEFITSKFRIISVLNRKLMSQAIWICTEKLKRWKYIYVKDSSNCLDILLGKNALMVVLERYPRKESKI